MNKKTVVLGGKSYTICELPARKNAGWRKGLERQLQPIMSIVEQAGAGLELRNSDDLLKVVGQVSQLLVTAPDLLIDLLFSYVPELDADREALLDNAYDSELIAAFTTVLGMAYPFGSLASLARLAAGSMTPPSAPTSLSLPSPNGVNSAKSLTT